MRTLEDKEIEILKKQLEVRKKKHGTQKLRTVIYARKSAEDEKQTSLSTQISNCQKFIENYDFLEYTHTFQEDNVSGMFTNNRTEYLEMMNQAEHGEIDVIVVMKLDRLARDLGDSTTTIKLLQLYGCYLIAGDDISDSGTPAGEFMRSILLAQNQYVARRVASDVMATECNNAKNGLTAGGIPPYGLKVIDKQFEIDETEAPAIRILFEHFAKGYSYGNIADELERLGFKTRSGKKFSYSTLYSLLRNDKYYGTFVYNRIGGKKKRNRVLIEHFDEVRNAEAIPPIISKELFDEVQQKLDFRSEVCRPRQVANSAFVLTGLLFCKSCGGSMSGGSYTGGRGKKKYRAYSCLNHKSRRKSVCSTRDINADSLEFAVKTLILDSVNDYLTTSPLSAEIFADLEKEQTEKIGILSRRVSELEVKINHFLDKAANPSTSAKLAERYEQQVDQYIEVQEQKRKDIATLNEQVATIQRIMDCFLDRTETLTMDELFPTHEVTRELFHIFISRIEIDDAKDDINIIFNE